MKTGNKLDLENKQNNTNILKTQKIEKLKDRQNKPSPL